MKNEELKSRGKNKLARLVALRLMLAIIKESTIDFKIIEKSGHTAFLLIIPRIFGRFLGLVLFWPIVAQW
jgi:hypothetical protein